MSGIGDWLPSVIDGFLGLFGLGNSAENRRSQEKMNQQNLDYAKAMTEKQWERDDTSYQRSVADATAAGFSPLAVLDGGLSPNGSPLAYQGQAPQFDLNAALQAFSQAGNKLFESNESSKMQKHEMDKIQKEFKNEVDILTKQYDKIESQEQQNFIREMQKLEEMNKLDFESSKYKENLREAEQLGAINITYNSDFGIVQKENAKTMEAYSNYMSQYQNITTTSSDKENLSASAGTGEKLPGVNIDSSIELSDSSTQSSISYVEYAQQFWQDHIWYVYKPNYKVDIK